jgi:hypothetical protein
MAVPVSKSDSRGISIGRKLRSTLVLVCLIPALPGCPVEYFYEFNWKPVIQVTGVQSQAPVPNATVYFQAVIPDRIGPAPIESTAEGLCVPLTAHADPSLFVSTSTTTDAAGQAVLDITEIAFAGPPHTMWAPQAQLPWSAYRVRVDAGANVEVLTLNMLPGVTASGDLFAIQVLSIEPANPVFPPEAE